MIAAKDPAIVRRGRTAFRIVVAGAILVALLAGPWPLEAGEPPLNPALLELSPNRWHKLHQQQRADWRRQNHAAMAYDSRRGRLLVFGSDTHGANWDNSVHEFDPVRLQWETHYPPQGPETYHADERGLAVAGDGRAVPLATHAYDNLQYDPSHDRLWLAAIADHNPARKTLPGVERIPHWTYDLVAREWRPFENDGAPLPWFFASGMTYDEHRDTLVSVRFGVWELGPDRRRWEKVAPKRRHGIHYVVEYDPHRRLVFQFGDSKEARREGPPTFRVYLPGKEPGTRGRWEDRTPEGGCPAWQHYPVAYDREHAVFLLVIDDHVQVDRNGKRWWTSGQTARSYVYDPDTNRCKVIPGAELPGQDMNYMMAWDRRHRVFLLVTGDHQAPLTVWALRLEPEAL